MNITEVVRGPKIPYPGAKGKLATKLVASMPETGNTFIDLFGGRGNVFLTAALNCRFQKWVINDISTAPFFSVLRDHGAEVTVPERSRSEYLRLKQGYKVGLPEAILCEPYITRNGGGYAKAGFGGLRSACRESYQKTLRWAQEILQKRKPAIYASDWRDLHLNRLGKDDFVFLDPPYMGADVRAYSSKGFDYEGMVRMLRKAKFRWLLTEYIQPLYIHQLGRPFNEIDVQLACDGIGTKRRVEAFWRNY